MRFVLASESLRRVDLLRMVGYDFEAQKSGFPEVFLDDPTKTVEVNARGKALSVALYEYERLVHLLILLPVDVLFALHRRSTGRYPSPGARPSGSSRRAF